MRWLSLLISAVFSLAVTASFLDAAGGAIDVRSSNFSEFHRGIRRTFDPRSHGITPVSLQSSDSTSNSDLHEYTPIRNTISQSGLQYYSFSVNASTGLGEYFEFLVFITGNICSQPDNHSSSDYQNLAVYYSFNSSMFTDLEISNLVHFERGYFEALAEVSVSETNPVLYIAVQAPQSTNTSDTWSYEIGVSQNDLVYQWDARPFAEVVDTDNQGVLIVTGNLTQVSDSDYSSYNASVSNYELLVFDYAQKDRFSTLNESWCAVKNGPSLQLDDNYVTSYTVRGGALRQQFYVNGLNESTKYVAYLVWNSRDDSGNAQGGTLYKPFEFETLSSDACKLIYDLDFCDQVAYSVAASSDSQYDTVDELKTLYDDHAKSLFTNFSKALQQIACNTTANAIFSPLGSCSRCNDSYRNWLCAVTIPRCSTRNITGYLPRNSTSSRTDFIDDVVRPISDYYEVLPCVNVCQVMARDCPADFGFDCPRTNASISLSYYWDDGGEYASCNFVGTASVSSAWVLRLAWGVVLSCTTFLMITL